MTTLFLFLIAALFAAWTIAGLTRTVLRDGYGMRPGPRSHHSQLDPRPTTL